MSENQFTAAATAVIPEFEEALKKIDVEIARARSFLAGLPAKEPQLFPTDEK